MNQLTDLFNRLMQADYSEAWITFTDVLRNPTNNIAAFALIIAALTVVMLVVVLLLLLAFMGGDDEEDEYEDEEGVPVAVAAAPVIAVEDLPEIPLTPEEIKARRIRRYISALIWLLIFSGVWIIGGVVTRQDVLCESCHVKTIHAARLDESKGADPHKPVRCVACHETSNIVASVTTAVPGRGIHFIGGMLPGKQALNYGTPVANSSCAGCHEAAIEKTVTNEVRGIRTSHREPLEASALCTDCHVPLPSTGIVNGYTVGMEPCLRCHNNKDVTAECTFCHTKDTSFAVQSRGVYQARVHNTNIDCGGCHSQATCDACHGIRMPHTVQFMGAGHARPGVEDLWYNGGRTCSRCHNANNRPCSKCHNSMPSHGVDYMPKGHQSADPYNNGCDGCHGKNAWIVGRNYCGLCHPEYDKPVRRQ